MDNDQYYEKIKTLEKEETNEQIKQIGKYLINNGKLYKERKDGIKRVIPRYELEAVMYLVHNDSLSGHLGINKCYDKLRERFYWKGMLQDVKQYIKTCDKCQRRGKPTGKNELHPIKVKGPFDQIGIDFVGPLPTTE